MAFTTSFSTEQLVNFLRVQPFTLDDEDFSLLYVNKIDGYIFCSYSEEQLLSIGFSSGSAKKLIVLIQNLKDQTFLSSGKVGYFVHIPYFHWSLEHFSNWVLSCWPSLAGQDLSSYFYQILGQIRDDDATFAEVNQTIVKLFKKKKVSITTSIITHFSLMHP